MSGKEYRNFTSEQKFKILCDHLIKKVPISELCATHRIQPSQFYQWQKQLMENGAQALERKKSSHNESLQVRSLSTKIESLSTQLEQRNEVLAELMFEHVQLKKKVTGAS